MTPKFGTHPNNDVDLGAIWLHHVRGVLDQLLTDGSRVVGLDSQDASSGSQEGGVSDGSGSALCTQRAMP